MCHHYAIKLTQKDNIYIFLNNYNQKKIIKNAHEYLTFVNLNSDEVYLIQLEFTKSLNNINIYANTIIIDTFFVHVVQIIDIY
jgi:hypothetical protein